MVCPPCCCLGSLLRSGALCSSPSLCSSPCRLCCRRWGPWWQWRSARSQGPGMWACCTAGAGGRALAAAEVWGPPFELPTQDSQLGSGAGQTLCTSNHLPVLACATSRGCFPALNLQPSQIYHSQLRLWVSLCLPGLHTGVCVHLYMCRRRPHTLRVPWVREPGAQGLLPTSALLTSARQPIRASHGVCHCEFLHYRRLPASSPCLHHALCLERTGPIHSGQHLLKLPRRPPQSPQPGQVPPPLSWPGSFFCPVQLLLSTTHSMVAGAWCTLSWWWEEGGEERTEGRREGR